MVLFFVKFTQVSACDEQGHGPQSCSFNELVDLIACVITQIKPWQLFPCEVSDGEELLENVIEAPWIISQERDGLRTG